MLPPLSLSTSQAVRRGIGSLEIAGSPARIVDVEEERERSPGSMPRKIVSAYAAARADRPHVDERFVSHDMICIV